MRRNRSDRPGRLPRRRAFVSFRWSVLTALLIAFSAGCEENSSQPADASSHPSSDGDESTGGKAGPETAANATVKSAERSATLPKDMPARPAPRALQPDDWFETVPATAGVRFQYSDGSEAGLYEIIESVGGGAALFDYDQDGDIDLFVAGGGKLIPADDRSQPASVQGAAGVLLRNDTAQGGAIQFVDVTRELGLDDSSLYTHGAAVGDFNSDGFPDLYVAGYQGVRLFQNEGGKHFTDIAAQAGLNCAGWNVGGAFADYDGDGLLDLYVMTYARWEPNPTRSCKNDALIRDVCPPTLFEGEQDRLFRNLGEGRFEDVTKQAGLVPGNRGLGLVAADMNRDGRIDFFVGNDVEDNQLYLGQEHLPFDEQGALYGVSVSTQGLRQGTMGAAVDDFDRDGILDLMYVNYATEDSSLLKGDGSGFVDVTARFSMLGLSRPYVSFGTIFADFNSDGTSDIALANGHVAYEWASSPYHQPAQLFENLRGEKFVERTAAGGPYFSVPHCGRGLAAGDLDNDGALDMVIVHQDEPIAVLRNRILPKQWVRLSLQGVQSNRDAIGAIVTLKGAEPAATPLGHERRQLLVL